LVGFSSEAIFKRFVLYKRDKVKQFNCIDEYNKFIHQIEDQIKNEDKERHQLAIQNQGNDDNNKRDLELRSIFIFY